MELLWRAAIVVFYFVLKKHSALANKVLVDLTCGSLVCGGVTDHSLLSRFELVFVIQSLSRGPVRSGGCRQAQLAADLGVDFLHFLDLLLEFHTRLLLRLKPLLQLANVGLGGGTGDA